jgi:hypothetical protein
MKSWIKGTFSDNGGIPSFKRQLVAFLTVVLCFTLFSEHSGHAETVAYLIAGILSITGVEKFTKNV